MTDPITNRARQLAHAEYRKWADAHAEATTNLIHAMTVWSANPALAPAEHLKKANDLYYGTQVSMNAALTIYLSTL